MTVHIDELVITVRADWSETQCRSLGRRVSEQVLSNLASRAGRDGHHAEVDVGEVVAAPGDTRAIARAVSSAIDTAAQEERP